MFTVFLFVAAHGFFDSFSDLCYKKGLRFIGPVSFVCSSYERECSLDFLVPGGLIPFNYFVGGINSASFNFKVCAEESKCGSFLAYGQREWETNGTIFTGPVMKEKIKLNCSNIEIKSSA